MKTARLEPVAATIAGVAANIVEWMSAGGAILGFLVSLLTFFWWVRIWWRTVKGGGKALPEKPDFD